jgi:integrase
MGKLTALEVASLTKWGNYCDGGGLWLQVSKWGTKSWVFRYERFGKRRHMGLGALHTVSLAEARTRARQMRQTVLDGEDPLDKKREKLIAQRLAKAKHKTFAECAADFIAAKGDGFKNAKHRAQWKSTLEKHAYPVIGDLPVSQIDTTLVLKILRPLWKQRPETASRVRGRIERILDAARVAGYRTGDNPARWKGHLRDLFSTKPKPKHHRALPFAELPAFMAELRDRDSISGRALEFLILTATRAMLMMLRGMQSNGLTVHGFRSSFRDWAGDRTAYPHDVIEFALAHKIPDKASAAYRRYRALDKRRRLMADWSTYCATGPKLSQNVVAIGGGRP